MAEMFITPIQLMNPVGQTTAKTEAETAAQDVISSFKGIFENAINDVKTTDDTLAKAQYLLATGQTEDPHSVTIAASEAQLAVDMLVALRSKALEAYNEIMRISSQIAEIYGLNFLALRVNYSSTAVYIDYMHILRILKILGTRRRGEGDVVILSAGDKAVGRVFW